MTLKSILSHTPPQPFPFTGREFCYDIAETVPPLLAGEQRAGGGQNSATTANRI